MKENSEDKYQTNFHEYYIYHKENEENKKMQELELS